MWKVIFKDRIFNTNGTVEKTRVQIQEEQSSITKILNGDLASETDETLIHLTLEQFYQDTFPNRAENERFAKVDEKLIVVDTKLAEMDKMKKELEITQGSLMDLITQISGSLEAENHEDNSQPKNTTEGGDSNDGNAIRN